MSVGQSEGAFAFARKPEEMHVGTFGAILTCCFYLLIRSCDTAPSGKDH